MLNVMYAEIHNFTTSDTHIIPHPTPLSHAHRDVLHLEPGAAAVVSNGRVLHVAGPAPKETDTEAWAAWEASVQVGAKNCAIYDMVWYDVM